MRSKIAIGVIAVLVAGLTLAGAADSWVKKDYRTWTEKECRKILGDSPWARLKTLSQVYITPLGAPPGSSPSGTLGVPSPGPGPGQQQQDDAAIRGRESNPRMTYQVQLTSAGPVRQAIVRLQQLHMDYDNMTPEKKQEFDAEAERYLATEFSETVVVQVYYGSNIPHDDQDMARHWQNQTTDLLKNTVFLMGGKGMKVPLLQYSVAEGSGRMFQMVFPRFHEGEPLLGPKDKSLKIEFPHPEVRGQRAERILIEFKTKKMRVGEAVAF